MELAHNNNRMKTDKTTIMDLDRIQVLGGYKPHTMKTHGDNHQEQESRQ